MSEKHKTVYQKFYEEVVPCLSEKCLENCDLENVESFLNSGVPCKKCARLMCSDYKSFKEKSESTTTTTQMTPSVQDLTWAHDALSLQQLDKDAVREKIDLEKEFGQEGSDYQLGENSEEFFDHEYQANDQKVQKSFEEISDEGQEEELNYVDEGQEEEYEEKQTEDEGEETGDVQELPKPILIKTLAMASCLKENCLDTCRLEANLLDDPPCYLCMNQYCPNFITFQEILDQEEQLKEDEAKEQNGDDLLQNEEEDEDENSDSDGDDDEENEQNFQNEQKTPEPEKPFAVAEMCAKSFCYNQCRNIGTRSLIGCKNCVIEICNKSCLQEKCTEQCGYYNSTRESCFACSSQCPTRMEKLAKENAEIVAQEMAKNEAKKQERLQRQKERMERVKEKIQEREFNRANRKLDQNEVKSSSVFAILDNNKDQLQKLITVSPETNPGIETATTEPETTTTEPEIDQEFQPQNDTSPRKLTGADFVPACAPACAALCDTPTETCAICIHRVCAGL